MKDWTGWFRSRMRRFLHWALVNGLTSVVSLSAGEAVVRNGWYPVWQWLWSHPEAAVVNLMLMIAVVAFGMGIFGKTVGSILLGLLYVMYSLINRCKQDILGLPVVSSDFRLGFQHMDTLKILMGEHAWAFWPIILLMGAALVYLYRKMPRGGFTGRVAGLAIGIAVLLPVFGANLLGQTGWVQPTWFSDVLEKKEFRYVGWDLRENTYRNGQLLAIAWNFEQSLVVRPRGYDPSAVERHYAEWMKPPVKRPDIRPDIIVVMSEAWWDPLVMTGSSNSPFSWTGIPAPSGTFWGEVVSPVVGGLTCNAEFEFLTGYTMAFLPQGTIPYVDYILGPVFSLARHFRSLGYQTMAVHPFERNFWARDRVYESLGFDRYLAVDDFVEPEISGYYVSDRSLAEKILQELQKPDSLPQFVFAISMQNHLPFDRGKYPESRLEAVEPWIPDTLSQGSREAMGAFLIGARDAWKAYVNLADGLQKRGRPAVLIQFGDHLPGLDQVYVETGFVSERDSRTWSPQEKLRMHTLPVAIWESHGKADRRLKKSEPLGLSFLGSRVLEAYELQGGNPYWLANLSDSYTHPVLLQEFFSGPLASSKVGIIRDSNTVRIQEWRQYDGMFGRRQNLVNHTILADIEKENVPADMDET